MSEHVVTDDSTSNYEFSTCFWLNRHKSTKIILMLFCALATAMRYLFRKSLFCQIFVLIFEIV